jgi:SAM-dependent methyltransferase
VDILDAHLRRARAAAAPLGPRVSFENRSVYDLGFPAGAFDLTVCRHVLQAIPHAERAIAELVRVTRRGGRVHLVAEDYGMIHFPRRRLDPIEAWPVWPARFGAAIGTDLFIGRRAPAILHGLGVSSVAVDYVVVDTIRVPRPVFSEIWEAWRDGYVDVVAEKCGVPRDEVAAHFEDQLATIRDPGSYAAWIVPVVSGIAG